MLNSSLLTSRLWCRFLTAVSTLAFASIGFAQSPYIVQKTTKYVQAGPVVPVIDFATPYLVEVDASDLAPATVAITLPGGTSRPIGRSPGGDLAFNQDFFSKSAMDAAFPSGNYAFTGPGLTGLNIVLPSDLYPTTVPQVTNGTWNSGGMLVIDPAQNYAVNFNTFAGYATAGVAGVVGIDGQWGVGNFDGTYVGTALLQPVGVPTQATPITSVVIPARTMTAGRV